MSGAKPPVGPACDGINSHNGFRFVDHGGIHCPGCAESASLRQRLATAEAERDRWVERTQDADRALRERLREADRQFAMQTEGMRRQIDHLVRLLSGEIAREPAPPIAVDIPAAAPSPETGTAAVHPAGSCGARCYDCAPGPAPEPVKPPATCGAQHPRMGGYGTCVLPVGHDGVHRNYGHDRWDARTPAAGTAPKGAEAGPWCRGEKVVDCKIINRHWHDKEWGLMYAAPAPPREPSETWCRSCGGLIVVAPVAEHRQDEEPALCRCGTRP
jgi:hypothetical protein